LNLELFSSGYFVGYRVEPAGFLQASETSDAIGVIGRFIKPDPHRTIIITGFTLCAFPGVVDHSESTVSIEKRIDGAQGTGHPAKRSATEYHPDQKYRQYGQFIIEQQPDEAPQARFQDHHGNTGLQRTGRAHEFTEPGHSISEVIGNRQWKKKNKKYQKNIFPII